MTAQKKKRAPRERMGEDLIPFRAPTRIREQVESLADAEGVPMAVMLRGLLEPALTLAERFGWYNVTSDLRRQAKEALGLSGTTLGRKIARAKAKLPLKTSSKSGSKVNVG